MDGGQPTVLITGGTGSFGSTVTRQLLAGDVGEVRILSRDEAKQDDLRRWLNDSRARFYVGDVRDPKSVADAMTGVDYVFHAAALKQVPSCEFFPLQAVATNVQGSDNVIRAAHECGVKSVVCLSTDKAVYPINAMGISKAMMEKVAQAFARNHPESRDRGVDHPLRQRDVLPRLGDPAVRRAGPLRAAADGHRPGHDPVPDVPGRVGGAGAVRIRQRPARGPVRAQGPRLDRGRPGPGGGPGAGGGRAGGPGDRHPARGEAATSRCSRREEMAEAEDCGDYYRVPLDGRSLNYGMYVEQGTEGIDEIADYTSHNTRRLTVEEVAEILEGLPEMQTGAGGGEAVTAAPTHASPSPGRTGSSPGTCAAPPGRGGAGT